MKNVDIVMRGQQKNQANTSAAENNIDNLVYHLYGLSYDEVLIIDPSTPITKEEYENKIL